MPNWTRWKSIYKFCTTRRRVIYCCILTLVLLQFVVFHWNKSTAIKTKTGAVTKDSVVDKLGAVTRKSLPQRDIALSPLQQILPDINKTRNALVHSISRKAVAQHSPSLEVFKNTSNDGDVWATESATRHVLEKHRESRIMRRPDARLSNGTEIWSKVIEELPSGGRSDRNTSLAAREERLKRKYSRLAQYRNFTKKARVNMTLENEKHDLIVSKLNKKLLRKDICEGCFKHNFNYVIPGDHICSGRKTIDLVFLITTAPAHFKRRAVLRNTWLTDVRKASNLAYVFLLGETANRNLSKHVELESKTHKDIIQEDFMDTYRNLTYKTVMALKWVTQACSQAKYVMKTDDDMFIYSHSLVSYLQDTTTQTILENSTIGKCWKARPIRENHPKYFVSYESYPRFYFPHICAGTGYLMSMRTARKVYDVSENVPFFHLEDVYFALCLEQLGLGTHNHPGFSVQTRSPLCAVGRRAMYSVHTASDMHIQRIWNSCKYYDRNRNRIRSGFEHNSFKALGRT